MLEADIDASAQPRPVDAACDTEIELEQTFERLRLISFRRIQKHLNADDRTQRQMRDLGGCGRYLAQYACRQRMSDVIGRADFDLHNVAAYGIDIILRDDDAHDRVVLAHDIANDVTFVQKTAGEVGLVRNKELSSL